ncbi:hypothetical protein SAMN05444320_105319 [Streptoalloteichus hindustanus]|uniref:Uncharacterized protein n=1 Tax=Streptoalloteichus hindustanus TaxID=2017 RepID=A0A1M5F8S1_STRHI|nr:hypothetical protein SAMN05444320_105319 [Streptoalloteichus hindustanus]
MRDDSMIILMMLPVLARRPDRRPVRKLVRTALVRTGGAA